MAAGAFEVRDGFLGENVRIGKVVGFEALISQPEDVQAGFVAVDEFLVGTKPAITVRPRSLLAAALQRQ
jgi:hypothetical protein